MHSTIIIDNKAFRLGHRIGKGGEGAVFLIGDDSGHAVKLYSTPSLEDKEQKIAAMVRAQLASQTSLVAFPISIARSTSGTFVGFVMKLVSDHKPLHDIYSPGSRRQHFPQADYRFLVRTAANFARVVAKVHKAGCVIGDINHSGILVSPKATVTLIDADSFQFSESGKEYYCRVGVPEYTPPELQGHSFDGLTRTTNHDSFGMAVVIFQLLFMGRHPFVGTVRTGEIPPLHENIQNFRYAYSNRDVGMDQPPGTPSLVDFSPEIAKLFDNAFSRPTSHERPTAEQWVKQLDALESTLEKCQDNPLHYIPRDASECSWCDMERQLGTVLFVPYIPIPALRAEGFDPGAGGFNLDLISSRIQAIIRATVLPAHPNFPPEQLAPSTAATEAKKSGYNIGSYLMIAIAFGGIFVLPHLFILWLIIGYAGYSNLDHRPLIEQSSIERTKFVRAYTEALTNWNRAISNWQQRTGYADFQKLAGELTEASNQYRSLANEEKSLYSKYQSERRQKHLYAFLDRFDIQHHSIRGIGPAKQALLASYGIDTAADVTRQRVLSVPGFGEVNSQGLLQWRENLEKRFVYNEQPSDTDKQEKTRIGAMIEAKAAPLRRKLLVGPQNSELLAKRVKQAVTTADPSLRHIYRQLEQAKCDLNFLGIPIPVPASMSPQLHATSTLMGPRPGYSASSNAPMCPRCGSQMNRRVARRGRYAGRPFWGCSRYPACKGIVSV